MTKEIGVGKIIATLGITVRTQFAPDGIGLVKGFVDTVSGSERYGEIVAAVHIAFGT